MTHIAIDTSKKEAKLFLEYAKTLAFVTFYDKPNSTTLKAMREAKKHKSKRHGSAKELILSLNK